MSAVMTPPRFADGGAYLAWEALQTERHEYLNGEILATTGARAAHNLMAGNACTGLRQVLRGAPCSLFDDVDFSPAAAPTPPLPQAEPPPA